MAQPAPAATKKPLYAQEPFAKQLTRTKAVQGKLKAANCSFSAALRKLLGVEEPAQANASRKRKSF